MWCGAAAGLSERMPCAELADSIVQTLVGCGAAAFFLSDGDWVWWVAAAGFSGRMPCAELADSIVQTAREFLERAMSIAESPVPS